MADAFICDICDDMVEGKPKKVICLCKKCCHAVDKDGKKHTKEAEQAVVEVIAEPQPAVQPPKTKGGRTRKVVVVEPEPLPERKKKPGVLLWIWQKLIGSDV